MSDILYQRIKDNLEVLKMKSTLTTLDNYLERAVKDDLNIVEVLDHIFAEEAAGKETVPNFV